MEKKEPDHIDDLVAALVTDLRTTLKNPPRLADLADLRAAVPRAVTAIVRAMTAEAGKTIAVIERQQDARRKAIDEAIEKDVSTRIERAKAADARPAVTPRKGVVVVAGRITDKHSGVGLPNVALNIFDLDRGHDDLLGRTRTDDQGYYRLEYTAAEVDDRRDRKAEIYLQVLDDADAVAHQTPRSFFEKAGPVVELDAAIDGAKVPASLALAEAVALRRTREIARYEAQRKRVETLKTVRLPVATGQPHRRKAGSP